ncbi:hypothetical protein [Duganella sp. CF458]|uniref:hypothetical protein n=1 Tax=Duganella sp. CF458 TaxID=1884368 RepID=UPI00111342F1|nr:hypothetical protein [Duganella sp. CF458]
MINREVRSRIAQDEPERLGELEAAMLARIDMLLALAVHHGHTALVRTAIAAQPQLPQRLRTRGLCRA